MTLLETITYPQQFKYPKIEVVIFGQADLQGERSDSGIKSIRPMHARENPLRAVMFISDYQVAEVAAVAGSGRLCYVSTFSTKSKWLRGTALHVSVCPGARRNRWWGAALKSAVRERRLGDQDGQQRLGEAFAWVLQGPVQDPPKPETTITLGIFR